MLIELSDYNFDENLTPLVKRILTYCWMPCRIQDFPFIPQTWIFWMLHPELDLLTYKYIKSCRAKQLKEIPDLPSEGILIAFDIYWMMLSSWIYKNEWKKSHKLPRMEKETKKAIELEGKMWLSLLEVCRALVGYHNEDKAVGLWGAALFESKVNELKKFYNPNRYPLITGNKQTRKVKLAYGVDTNKQWENNGKQAIKQAFQSHLKALRQGKNPFNPMNQPWLCSITRSAFDILKSGQNSSYSFKEKFWQPFLSNRSAWVSNFESQGINFLWAENKEWYSRFPGTKRGGRKIPVFNFENYPETISLAQKEFQELSHSLIYSPKNERLWIQGKNRTLLDSGQG